MDEAWDHTVAAFGWALKTEEPLVIGRVGGALGSELIPDEIEGVIGWLERKGVSGGMEARCLDWFRRHRYA